MGISLRESSCKLRHCLSRNGHQSDIVARSGRRSFLSIGSKNGAQPVYSMACIRHIRSLTGWLFVSTVERAAFGVPRDGPQDDAIP